jgi:hypothetical protein
MMSVFLLFFFVYYNSRKEGDGMDTIKIVNDHHIEMVNKVRNKEIRKWADERRSELQEAEKEEKAAEAIADFILPKYCRGSERFQAAIGIVLILLASIILSIVEVYYAVCGYDSAFTCGMGALMGTLGAGALLAELKFGK